MTRFVGLYAEPKKGDWRLEVVRMIVDRAPMKIKPTPLPERKDPSQVKSEFGFCGAGDLRSDIAAIESKIKAIEEQAEQITVDLPLAASWEGLWRRTEVIRDIELESQRIAKEVLDAANKSKVTMRAIGVERDIIIAEMVGTKKERGKIEQALPKDIVERARPSDTDTPGFVRMMIVNRTAEKRHKAEDKFRKQMEQRKSGANP